MKYPIYILTILLCFTTLICTDLHGQYYRQINSIDFTIGGDYGFRRITGDASQASVAQILANRKSLESPQLGYRIGFNYNYSSSENILIKTGIRYSRSGFNITGTNPFDNNVNLNDISKIADNIDGVDYKYRYQMIEVPIGIRYIFARSICQSYLEVGIAPNFYLNTIVSEYQYESHVSNEMIDDEISQVLWFGVIGIGGDFYLNRTMVGFTQLNVRYQLNDLRNGSAHDLVTERLLGIGLEAGIRYLLE